MGWAARAKARRLGRPEPVGITGLRCAEVARVIRRGVEELGVNLDPQNDLAKMIREAEWLASLGDGEPTSWRVATHADEERIERAAFVIEQARRIGASLQVQHRIGNVESLRKWLRKRINRLNGHDSEAQDHLLELEMAGRLARWPDLDVAIDEPDIAFEVAGHRIIIACKRPRALGTVGDNIAKARRQIRDARKGSGRLLPAVILVGVESIFHRRDDGSIHVPQFELTEDATDFGSRQLDAAAEAGLPEVRRAFEEGISGAIFTGCLAFSTNRPPAVQSAHIQNILSNEAEQGGPKLTEQVARLLFPRSQEIAAR